MDSDNSGRVGVIFRLPLSLLDALQQRLAATPGVSRNRYLEQLIHADLDSPASPFAVYATPTSPARGARGHGRPTKGSRAAILLRLDLATHHRIHERAAELQLRLTDYLDSLVATATSAANVTTERR